MASRGEETPSQGEKVGAQKQFMSLEEFRKITERNVTALDKLIAQIELPKGNPEWIEKEIPFRERDFHLFLGEIMKLNRTVSQLHYTIYALAQETLDLAQAKVNESEEKTSAIARISAGEAVLEMLEKTVERSYQPPDARHLDPRYV
ncbi:MAG: hypothetical protein ABSG74_08610 [Candidatus Bathyarchaeia archaeon]